MNGLRDDDDESFYGSRASFMSEYSVRDEGMQVFFKEHGRKGSKDSQSSFLSRSRKKVSTTQAQKRPETKVLIFKFERIRVALIFPPADSRSSSVRRLRSDALSTTSRMRPRPVHSTSFPPVTAQPLSSRIRLIGPLRSASSTCSTRLERHSLHLPSSNAASDTIYLHGLSFAFVLCASFSSGIRSVGDIHMTSRSANTEHVSPLSQPCIRRWTSRWSDVMHATITRNMDVST